MANEGYEKLRCGDPCRYAPNSGELKWDQTYLTVDNVPDTPVYSGAPAGGPPGVYDTLRPLGVVAQGTTVSQRIGRVIYAKSFQCKLVVTSTAALTAACQCNVMLVYDTHCNGTILTPSNLQSGASTFIRSMRNLDYRDRFKVLLSRDFTVNPAGVSGSRTIVDIYKKLDHKILFSNTDALISSCPAGMLYFIISADAGDSTGLHYLNVSGGTRLRYVG